MSTLSISVYNDQKTYTKLLVKKLQHPIAEPVINFSLIPDMMSDCMSYIFSEAKFDQT